MKNQEIILIGIVAIMFIAAAYFAFTTPQAVTTDGKKTSPVLGVLLNGLSMGNGATDYYYSYNDTTNGYPKEYSLLKKGNDKMVTITSPLSIKEVYITDNSTILCVKFIENRTCEDITNNSNLDDYVAYMNSLFFNDISISTSKDNLKYLFGKGYAQTDDKITTTTVNGMDCSLVKYKLDYSNLTVTEASKFQIGPSSPKIFDFEWCIDNKTGNVWEYSYKYNYNGQNYFTKITTNAIEWNTSKTISVPTNVTEQNAVNAILDESTYVSKAMACYQVSGKSRDDCILRLAVEAKDLYLCEKAGSNRDVCYVVMTASKLKPEICNNILNVDYKDDCYIELSGGLKNASWCNMLKNQSKLEFCQNVSVYIPPTTHGVAPTNQTTNKTVPPQLIEIINKLETNSTQGNETQNNSS